ncbi:hypothetical protein ACLESD_13955 [Pyxidicoccus sp. 3LFB2]
MSAGLTRLVFDLVEAVESYGLGIQVMVGLFALGFVSTLVVRKKQRSDETD